MATAPTAEDLRLVTLLTSEEDASGDPFRDARRARAWCAEQGLDPGRRPPSSEELARLRALRAGLRGALGAPPGAAARRLAGLTGRARLTVEAGPDGPRIVPGAVGVDGVIGRVVLDACAAVDRGTWSRIRVCAAPGCGRVFLDTTRSRTRQWCDMTTCGNRAKVRAHRDRARTEERR